jgi:hypothetical protein
MLMYESSSVEPTPGRTARPGDSLIITEFHRFPVFSSDDGNAVAVEDRTLLTLFSIPQGLRRALWVESIEVALFVNRLHPFHPVLHLENGRIADLDEFADCGVTGLVGIRDALARLIPKASTPSVVLSTPQQKHMPLKSRVLTK